MGTMDFDGTARNSSNRSLASPKLQALFRRFFRRQWRDNQLVGCCFEDQFEATHVAPIDPARQRRIFERAETNRGATGGTSPRHSERHLRRNEIEEARRPSLYTAGGGCCGGIATHSLPHDWHWKVSAPFWVLVNSNQRG